jgi:hypothetical protein
MAMDYTFKIPATVKAGLMVVNFMNDGKEPHELSFLRLNEGVSVKQFQTQLEAFPPKAFLLSKWRGGVGPILPGQSERVVIRLDPGQYVLSCFVESPNGLPHFVEKMFAPFKVVANASTSQASDPTADGTITLKTYNFTLPKLTTGSMILKVTNNDQTGHELNILKLADGKTIQDIKAFLHQKKGPPPLDTAKDGPAPYTYAGGIQPLEPGASSWMELNLAPGHYVALCFVPEVTGVSHLDEGMIKAFTVQ